MTAEKCSQYVRVHMFLAAGQEGPQDGSRRD